MEPEFAPTGQRYAWAFYRWMAPTLDKQTTTGRYSGRPSSDCVCNFAPPTMSSPATANVSRRIDGEVGQRCAQGFVCRAGEPAPGAATGLIWQGLGRANRHLANERR
jgi:hypothetical protein